MLDIWVISDRTTAETYDSFKCTHGPAAPAGVPRRIGCINSESEFENKIEYRQVQKEFEIYKAQIAEEEG